MAEAAAGGFDIRRILLLAGVVIVVVIAVGFLFFRGCAPSVRTTGNGYLVIYSNLDLKDAANVVARLKELNIPYEIRDNGRAIAVPKDKADQARLGLAEDNLPAGGVVGWEIFDESRLGATDFDRRIQLIRAISGELSRTIGRIEAVDDARVQIVIPETRLFAATVAPVTASVMLRLKPGGELTSAKVNGIVHLVASSVENLQTENVTVVDDTGKILTAKGALKEAVAEKTRPFKAEVVEQPEEVVIKAVEEQAVMPSPEVIVKPEVAVKATPEAVSAEVAARPLTPEERILLRVQAKKEMEINLNGKAQEILNRFYPPNTVIVKVDVDLIDLNKNKVKLSKDFKIKTINAVILVDNRVALSPELKQSTFKAVAAAIGYNRKRGDKILLQKVPFHLATPPPAVIRGEVEKSMPSALKTKKRIAIPTFWYQNIGIMVGILLGSLILLIIIKKMGRRKAEVARVPVTETRRAAEAEAGEMPAAEKIRGMVDNNPERIAELLKNWLTE